MHNYINENQVMHTQVIYFYPQVPFTTLIMPYLLTLSRYYNVITYRCNSHVAGGVSIGSVSTLTYVALRCIRIFLSLKLYNTLSSLSLASNCASCLSQFFLYFFKHGVQKILPSAACVTATTTHVMAKIYCCCEGYSF